MSPCSFAPPLAFELKFERGNALVLCCKIAAQFLVARSQLLHFFEHITRTQVEATAFTALKGGEFVGIHYRHSQLMAGPAIGAHQVVLRGRPRPRRGGDTCSPRKTASAWAGIT